MSPRSRQGSTATVQHGSTRIRRRIRGAFSDVNAAHATVQPPQFDTVRHGFGAGLEALSQTSPRSRHGSTATVQHGSTRFRRRTRSAFSDVNAAHATIQPPQFNTVQHGFGVGLEALSRTSTPRTPRITLRHVFGAKVKMGRRHSHGTQWFAEAQRSLSAPRASRGQRRRTSGKSRAHLKENVLVIPHSYVSAGRPAGPARDQRRIARRVAPC